MDLDLIIQNATIVTATEILQPGLSIGIKSGQIVAIAFSLPADANTQIIDAEGAYVTPGGVDSHVHLHQDNAPTGDKWLSGSRSALCGGNTTVLAFATQQRTDESLFPVLEEYHSRARGQSYVDYGFHLILTRPSPEILGRAVKAKVDGEPNPGNEGELKRLVDEEGITSVKLYMTYPVFKLGDKDMLEVMMRCREVGMTVMVHAENADMIDMITTRLLQNSHTLPKYHALARPQIAESEATYRAISLSTLTSTPILIVHMSSPAALSHARKAQSKSMLPIHAETCPHYMYLLSDRLATTKFPVIDEANGVHSHDHGDVEDDEWAGARHVCAPPLRHADSDLQSVWDSVNNGTITVISSDHAPSQYHHPAGKRKPLIEAQKTNSTPAFAQIPNGLPGIETRLPILFSAATDPDPSIPPTRRLTLPKFVELTSTNPAKMYGLSGRKGSIAPGYDADLVIWYPRHHSTTTTTTTASDGKIKITNEILHHSIDYTPFEGFRVFNWPRYVLLRGQVKWNRDVEVAQGPGAGVLGNPSDGMFLKRGKGEVLVGRSGMGREPEGMKFGERSAWL
ncbi:dihydropyrimidinase [Fonsecaea pedrosoi CBS 271.37]|uniref:dihydropyrimidinase n=1 Tax=Fonsecaea pedrosoi CBS 271.37 TaxID=1442368 RepID=A0A0D2E4W3_9EURO|nr:dihydropyrimidinase [Fonsecaea pedrosoi CBS 271.37]KIW85116.1 dihydropyrimidinase [Fonsecaea pedrosoi CBS 271.37]